ncbi:MAG TPA: SMP-30/gluconolactonase/LRE family protein [Sphingobium sp.]
MRAIRTVIDNLVFAEGPRWYDGALYISTMHDQQVLKITEAGEAEVIAALDDATSGLGWLPDGRLLVVAMHTRKVMRRESDGTIAVHGDLNSIATYHANDMIAAADGTAYVGNFGFSIFPLGQPCPATLARVAPDGTVSPAAENLWFPNGIALTDDEKTLIVAESGAYCLTAFTVGADGSLNDRRMWASLGDGNAPDGFCLDAEGAAWVALPHQKKFVRVREGGEIADTIPVDRHALACVLGGSDRRTLYMAVSEELEQEKCLSNPSAAVLAAEVDVAGQGKP